MVPNTLGRPTLHAPLETTALEVGVGGGDEFAGGSEAAEEVVVRRRGGSGA